jgi:RNA polymerase sigma-70 factor (ECF subfamily)
LDESWVSVAVVRQADKHMALERRFEALVRQHHPAVTAYAKARANNSALAEDAVQETFLRAWRYLDSFRGEGSFEGWLIRICRRCIIDLERSERRQSQPVDMPCTEADTGGSTTEVTDIMATLPMEHREVLVLCGVLGYDYESAAAVLDIPVGTVRSRLSRARHRMAGELGHSVGESESA